MTTQRADLTLIETLDMDGNVHPLKLDLQITGEIDAYPVIGDSFRLKEIPNLKGGDVVTTTPVVGIRDEGNDIFFRTKRSTYKLHLRRD